METDKWEGMRNTRVFGDILSILTLSSVSGCSQSASPFRQCFWDISDLHPAQKTEKVRFGQKSKKVKSYT